MMVNSVASNLAVKIIKNKNVKFELAKDMAWNW